MAIFVTRFTHFALIISDFLNISTTWEICRNWEIVWFWDATDYNVSIIFKVNFIFLIKHPERLCNKLSDQQWKILSEKI